MFSMKFYIVIAFYLLGHVNGQKLPPPPLPPPSMCKSESCIAPTASKIPPGTLIPKESKKPLESPAPPMDKTQHSPLATGIHKLPPTSDIHRPYPTPSIDKPFPASDSHRPLPTQGMPLTNHQQFFTRFYKAFGNLKLLMKEATSDPKTSVSQHSGKTEYPKPTPSPANSENELKRRIAAAVDNLGSLIFEDFNGKEGMKSATPMHMKPTPTLSPTPAGNGNKSEDKHAILRNLILNGFKEEGAFMESIVPSAKINIHDDNAVREFVRGSLSQIATGYWKLTSWFVRKMEALPCDKDCRNLATMIQFCKKQHSYCEYRGPPSSMIPAGSPTVPTKMPLPTPHLAVDRPCSAGQKRCPFRSECIPENIPCINNMDIFEQMKQLHSSIRVMPSPSPLAQRPKIEFKPANQSMLEFAWKEAAKVNPLLKPEYLKQTFDKLQVFLQAPAMKDGNIGEREGRNSGFCTKRCPREGSTFCWAEMKCSRVGAKCSLQNLREMMNKTEFLDRQNCSASYFCPILQNCTMDEQSCNASRLLQAYEMKPSQEDIAIYRLRCKDGEKYCPDRVGCISVKESCAASKKLDVSLGNSPEDERMAICRLKDYICPRVYNLKQKIQKPCDILTVNEPIFENIGRPTDSPMIKPTMWKPHSKSTEISPDTTKSSHSIQPTPPSVSLPSVTLNSTKVLSMQIKLSSPAQYIAISKLACPPSFEFNLVYRGGIGKVKIPSEASGKGVLLKLEGYLRFDMTDKRFHGLCSLKYTEYRPPPRMVVAALQEVSVPPDRPFGHLAVVVLPSIGGVVAEMTGKNFINIKEDDERPTCFKVGDIIKFNKTVVDVASAIKPEFESMISGAVLHEYKAKLAAIRHANITVAIIGSKGISFRSGIWKYRNGGSMNALPRYFSRREPFIIGVESCIAFVPAKDFNGEVSLFVVGALSYEKDKRPVNVLGTQVFQVGVRVTPEPDEPEMSGTDSCFPPYPYEFNGASNNGFKIEDVLASGKRSCGSSNVKASPVIKDITQYRSKNIGIAITGVSQCSEFGHWESSVDGARFSNINLEGMPALCLLQSARLRFVPANYSKLWSVPQAQECVWVNVKAFLSLKSNGSGPCNATSDGNRLLSKSAMQLSALRMGCDDKIGSMKKPDLCGRCGKKLYANIGCPCDGVPGSGAVIDECGQCSGGTTRRVFQRRDCANKCFSNGTLSVNVLDNCGRCQKRQFVGKTAQDCNGDCLFGSKRACRNKCGACVGGNTGKPINFGINDCGACAGSSACAKEFSLQKAVEVKSEQGFRLKVKARGYSGLRSVMCSVQKADGSSSVDMRGVAQIMARSVNPYPDACAEQEVGDYTVELKAVLRSVGQYNLRCKADSEPSFSLVANGSINVVSDSSVVQMIIPPEIDSCRNGTFTLVGTGFRDGPEIACGASCESRCDFKTRARYINGTAFECSIEVPDNQENCQAQEINLHALVSSAVSPPPFSKLAAKAAVQCAYPRAVSGNFNSRERLITIKLDKPASFLSAIKRERPSCENLFDSETAGKLGTSKCYLLFDSIMIRLKMDATVISSAVGSFVSVGVNRGNLRCKNRDSLSVLRGERVQRVNVSLPAVTAKAVIIGRPSVGKCDVLRLDGSTSSGGAGSRLEYNWKLIKNSYVIAEDRRKSSFKIDGQHLLPGADYHTKLCVRNIFGESHCDQMRLNVIDNSNNTLIVKIRGGEERKLKARGKYRFKPVATISQCGGSGKKVAQMLFTWQILSEDGSVVSNSEERNLEIKQGDLAPGKNYTLKCFVRAKLQSGDIVKAEASIKVEVEGSSLNAKIRGGRRMTVGCNGKVLLDARPSSDPDGTDESTRYAWSCSDADGLPCFNVSNPLQQLMFKESSMISFQASDRFACNKSYVMSLDYSKGYRKSSASVSIDLVPGKPAEVKLNQLRIQKRVILQGYVRTESSAKVLWKSIEKEGYGKIDLDDTSIVTIIRSGEISLGSRPFAYRSPAMIIDTTYLEMGQSYLVSLEVVNADDTSSAQIVVTAPSAPTQGLISIEPKDGVALNTLFSVSTDGGWSGEGLEYAFGFEQENKKGTKDIILKDFSQENFLDSIPLQTGNKRNNYTLTLFVKAKNLDGIVVKSTSTVIVRPSAEISKEKLDELTSSSQQAIKEKDLDKAFRSILLVASLINDGTAKQNISEGQPTAKEDLTDQVLSVFADAGKTALAPLEFLTKSVDGVAGIGEAKREEVAAKAYELLAGSSGAQTPIQAKRKRRSVENSGSQGTFTPLTKAEVDSSMAIFDNIINEQEPGSLQDYMKQNFTNTVPTFLRSLCANTLTANDFLISRSNLSTIRSNRLPGYSFDTENINMNETSSETRVMLGPYFKQKYENWNCSQSGLLCTEVCVATIMYHHHLFTGEFEGRISDILSATIVHPETHGIENIENLTQPIKYSIWLNELPDAQHTVECRVWNSDGLNWTKDGCNTSYSGGDHATCHCFVLGNVTVFKVIQPVVTTLFPPTTAAQTSTSPTQQSMQSTSNFSRSPSTTKRPTTQSGTSEPPIVVSFSFPVNYNDFAARIDDLKIAIVDMLSLKLRISKDRITNLKLTPGSIIVTFTLLNNDGHRAEADIASVQNHLNSIASNNSLSIVFDGVTLTADSASLKFMKHTTPEPPPPPKKETSDKNVILVVAVCVGAVLVFGLVAVLVYHHFKRKRARRLASAKIAGSDILFGDDIKLHERVPSADYVGIDNQHYTDSPEPQKRPLSPPVLLDDHNVEKRQVESSDVKPGAVGNSSRAGSAGAVVTVGIGSSASLKKSPLD